VVVTSPDLRSRLATVVREAVERLRCAVREDQREPVARYLERFGGFASAPVLIAPLHRAGVDLLRAGLAPGPDAPALPDRGERDALCSVSAAIMSLLLGAQALGLGACWMTGPLVAQAELEALLAVPRGWSLSALIPVGFPGEAPEAPPRRSLAAMVRRLDE
jgi:nitroreductase